MRLSRVTGHIHTLARVIGHDSFISQGGLEGARGSELGPTSKACLAQKMRIWTLHSDLPTCMLVIGLALVLRIQSVDKAGI